MVEAPHGEGSQDRLAEERKTKITKLAVGILHKFNPDIGATALHERFAGRGKDRDELKGFAHAELIAELYRINPQYEVPDTFVVLNDQKQWKGADGKTLVLIDQHGFMGRQDTDFFDLNENKETQLPDVYLMDINPAYRNKNLAEELLLKKGELQPKANFILSGCHNLFMGPDARLAHMGYMQLSAEGDFVALPGAQIVGREGGAGQGESKVSINVKGTMTQYDGTFIAAQELTYGNYNHLGGELTGPIRDDVTEIDEIQRENLAEFNAFPLAGDVVVGKDRSSFPYEIKVEDFLRFATLADSLGYKIPAHIVDNGVVRLVVSMPITRSQE